MFVHTGQSYTSFAACNNPHKTPNACCQARGAPPSPLHGPNQWPRLLPEFDAALRRHVRSCLGLGQALMRGAPPTVRLAVKCRLSGLDAMQGQLLGRIVQRHVPCRVGG